MYVSLKKTNNSKNLQNQKPFLLFERPEAIQFSSRNRSGTFADLALSFITRSHPTTSHYPLWPSILWIPPTCDACLCKSINSELFPSCAWWWTSSHSTFSVYVCLFSAERKRALERQHRSGCQPNTIYHFWSHTRVLKLERNGIITLALGFSRHMMCVVCSIRQLE